MVVVIMVMIHKAPYHLHTPASPCQPASVSVHHQHRCSCLRTQYPGTWQKAEQELATACLSAIQRMMHSAWPQACYSTLLLHEISAWLAVRLTAPCVSSGPGAAHSLALLSSLQQ